MLIFMALLFVLLVIALLIQYRSFSRPPHISALNENNTCDMIKSARLEECTVSM